jgi:uncharacterized repeat protein (TIGR01451 family)
VRAAPEPSAAQRDEIEALSAQVDTLDTEMRREMMERARPCLEASQAELVQAIENLGGQVLYRYSILNGVAAVIPPEARATIEGYALATEENFSAASPPAFSLGTSSYSQGVGEQWTVNVTVYNNGDVAAHNVNVSLSIPMGLSIVSGSNPQNVGTIGAGLNQIASWTLQADQTGSYSVPINVSSSSYGETFTGSGSFSVSVSDELFIYLPIILKNH